MDDLKPTSFQFAKEGEKLLEIPFDEKGTAHIYWDGKRVGTLSVKDGKTFHFEGNMDDSAASLLILLKKFIDNWLQLKDK